MKVDYGSILRRAWDIAWRNKSLWWLGLFAGGASTPNFNYSLNNANSSSSGFGSSRWSGALGSQASVLAARWLPFLIAIAMLVLLVILVSIVLSIAASGGLVTQANAAAEGRRGRAGQGWGDGFGRWGGSRDLRRARLADARVRPRRVRRGAVRHPDPAARR